MAQNPNYPRQNQNPQRNPQQPARQRPPQDNNGRNMQNQQNPRQQQAPRSNPASSAQPNQAQPQQPQRQRPQTQQQQARQAQIQQHKNRQSQIQQQRNGAPQSQQPQAYNDSRPAPSQNPRGGYPGDVDHRMPQQPQRSYEAYDEYSDNYNDNGYSYSESGYEDDYSYSDQRGNSYYRETYNEYDSYDDDYDNGYDGYDEDDYGYGNGSPTMPMNPYQDDDRYGYNEYDNYDDGYGEDYYNNNYYDNGYYDDNYDLVDPRMSSRNGDGYIEDDGAKKATLALILGIVSFVLSGTIIVGIICGVMAIIFAHQRSVAYDAIYGNPPEPDAPSKTKEVIGRILGIIGIVLSVITLFVFIYLFGVLGFSIGSLMGEELEEDAIEQIEENTNTNLNTNMDNLYNYNTGGYNTNTNTAYNQNLSNMNQNTSIPENEGEEIIDEVIVPDNENTNEENPEEVPPTEDIPEVDLPAEEQVATGNYVLSAGPITDLGNGVLSQQFDVSQNVYNYLYTPEAQEQFSDINIYPEEVFTTTGYGRDTFYNLNAIYNTQLAEYSSNVVTIRGDVTGIINDTSNIIIYDNGYINTSRATEQTYDPERDVTIINMNLLGTFTFGVAPQ